MRSRASQQTKFITRKPSGRCRPAPTARGRISPRRRTTRTCGGWPTGAESGWGINLTHQGDSIFATWFTYDSEGAPLWLAVTATRVEQSRVYSGQLIRTTGPAFNAVPFDPAKVTRTVAGTATFTFANGNAATFAYTLNGVSQTKAITRYLFEPPAGTRCGAPYRAHDFVFRRRGGRHRPVQRNARGGECRSPDRGARHSRGCPRADAGRQRVPIRHARRIRELLPPHVGRVQGPDPPRPRQPRVLHARRHGLLRLFRRAGRPRTAAATTASTTAAGTSSRSTA